METWSSPHYRGCDYFAHSLESCVSTLDNVMPWKTSQRSKIATQTKVELNKKLRHTQGMIMAEIDGKSALKTFEHTISLEFLQKQYIILNSSNRATSLTVYPIFQIEKILIKNHVLSSQCNQTVFWLSYTITLNVIVMTHSWIAGIFWAIVMMAI